MIVKRLRFLLLPFATILHHPAAAQQVRLGPELGLNLYVSDNWYKDYSGVKHHTRNDTRPALKLGLTADISINRRFSIQPAFLYNSKSFRFVDDTRFRLNYLEVPVLAVFRTPVDRRTTFYMAAGPYAALGFTGRLSGPYFARYTNIGFGNEEKHFYRPWDVGINVNAGMEFHPGFFFRIGYSFGLINVSPPRITETKQQLRGFSLSVGYFLIEQ